MWWRADALESAELAKIILAIGSAVGILGGFASAGLPLVVPQLFTGDRALHAIMRTVLPQVHRCCCEPCMRCWMPTRGEMG